MQSPVLDPGITEPVKRPRVVVAEDYVLIQENIRLAIQSVCDIVAAVEDGQAALEAVETHAADILLLDVSLRDMNGFVVAEKLLDSNSPVNIIFVTAHRDRAYIDRAFEIGAKGYLLKGTLWTELPLAIREVANGGIYRSPMLK